MRDINWLATIAGFAILIVGMHNWNYGSEVQELRNLYEKGKVNQCCGGSSRTRRATRPSAC